MNFYVRAGFMVHRGVDGHACMCIGIYNKTYIDYIILTFIIYLPII